MGKKYIIELPENTHWIQWIMESTKDHHPYMGFKQVEDLTPYTEPDLDHARKEAYEQGYYIGYTKYLNRSYEDGLKDAWEAAKKITTLDAVEQKKLFGCLGIYYIAKEFSAQEAIKKIQQYEQEKEEQIQVGDEVIATSGKAVIVSINDDKDKARYIYHDSTLGFDKVCNLSKTGRHFPEIAAVLEKMRGK